MFTVEVSQHSCMTCTKGFLRQVLLHMHTHFLVLESVCVFVSFCAWVCTSCHGTGVMVRGQFEGIGSFL